jgi:hypothetical protein
MDVYIFIYLFVVRSISEDLCRWEESLCLKVKVGLKIKYVAADLIEQGLSSFIGFHKDHIILIEPCSIKPTTEGLGSTLMIASDQTRFNRSCNQGSWW